MIKKTLLGKTKESVSIVAFGGIVAAQVSQIEANHFVSEAIDAGINYFDVAPTYFNAEDRLGPALREKRKDVFLSCKTENRTRAGSQKLLEESLKKMQTDYFDLYQLHAVYNIDDVEKTFGPNGSFDTYIKAKEKGIIKYIGFSAHSTEAALALMDRYAFDTIMFPFNFATLLSKGYGFDVLEKAKALNMGIVGIKSMALTSSQEGDLEKYPKAWYHPIENFNLASQAVRYSFAQGVQVIIPPGDIEHLRWAIRIASSNLNLSAEDLEDLKRTAHQYHPLFPLKER